MYVVSFWSECIFFSYVCVAIILDWRQVDPNDPNGPDLETRIDELRTTLRRADTSKVKYEARLDVLKLSGAPVEEWLKDMDQLGVSEPLQRSGSLLSVRTDASGAAASVSSNLII